MMVLVVYGDNELFYPCSDDCMRLVYVETLSQKY